MTTALRDYPGAIENASKLQFGQNGGAGAGPAVDGRVSGNGPRTTTGAHLEVCNRSELQREKIRSHDAEENNMYYTDKMQIAHYGVRGTIVRGRICTNKNGT